MNAPIKTAYSNEMILAKRAYDSAQLEDAFRHLERAHILGQRYFSPHLTTHWWMLKVAIRRTDGNEIRGQIIRMIAVVPGFLFYWVPTGNTGGANVSALKPMPIPQDLAQTLQGFNVFRAVMSRAATWIMIAAATSGMLFARGL